MQTSDTQPPYRDAAVSTPKRVADLLDRMTLEEKVGQLVGTWAGHLDEFKDVDDVRAEVVEHNVGAVASFGWGGAVDMRLDDIVDTVNRLQEAALSETRLGIPLLFNVDAVHGHAYVAEGTAFPNGLGAAATWDADAVERGASITATEVRHSGAHQNYSPTCDVARDPRWGRTFETFGESPYLCAKLAAAKVRGYQGDGIEDPSSVIATAKHFPAYSEPARGEDAAPVEISEYLLRNVFLPSFLDVLDEDVESVMPCYNAVDGEPAHGSRRYLTDLLRGTLGFDGTVVSDWGGVKMLDADHKITADHRDSVRQTREAGLDIASVDAVDHADHLVSLVERGEVAEAVVDDSVERVLEQKFRLGLFEDAVVDPSEARDVVGADAHREASLEVARDAMTLLKNDELLPLDGDADVLVAGPNADDAVHQLGGWSVPDPEGTDVVTIRDGIEATTSGSVVYEQGATMNETLDVEAAVEAAEDADVAVVAVGEPWYLHEFGPSVDTGTEPDEFPNRHTLHLPDAQRKLAAALEASGTPVVGVLVTGRPLIVDWMAEHVPAILMAYYPGTMGGQAVAETLFGENEPSGRLPISIPKSEGHLSTRFNHFPHPTPIGQDEHPSSYDPLFEFGHGRSYADFEYGDVALTESTVGPHDTTTVRVPVENVGDRAGSDVVQVYVTNHASSRITPVRELRGFERVSLDGGESATAEVELDAAELGQVGEDGDRQTDAGAYSVQVGDQTVELTVETTYD
ncbi:glycoside hydrolase family 3 N-terminal domain-containing protein [Haloarcula onubensis]|uniref:beta-glucosidase n=1 Tax=Haloarcula onubensis TaxID=2950539 RepID=A0ABU2FPN2_9EURY|nr:glycoside hydrolase family 3 N-terminal domain-containing protein [Halomicroarcula sp. S3CR25-11]MDS0282718.1 glycoside hydrolase family 3 C-terminal domain-containing protein [Halomicroarcula sp. S3CR25-11]